MRIELHSGLEAIEAGWRTLWRRSAAGPFQSPAWLLPWRRHFSEGDGMAIVLRHRDGGLAAIVPLFSLDGRLLPWGAGTSDYLDGIFDPGAEVVAVGHALAGAVADIGLPLDLFQVPPGSPLLAMPAPGGWEDESGESEPCPGLPLPAGLPPDMVRNLRYYRRRALKQGRLAAETGGPELLDDLFALHRARWRDRGEAGVLADPKIEAFHREAAPALARAGLLRLHRLTLDGRPACVLYGLQAKGCFHYYLSGFDPDLAGIGPGTLAIGHAMTRAEDEGADRFDFLRGREPYKYRWGAADRPTFARRLRPSRR